VAPEPASRAMAMENGRTARSGAAFCAA
jgi:hypothetical protein